MPDSEFDNISPTDISLSARQPAPEARPTTSSEPDTATPTLGMGNTHQAFQNQQKNNKALWGIFGLLLILVLGVVVILPKLISPTNVDPTVVVVRAPAAPGNQGSEITPFQEAQILRQREAAQNILAALLELQEALEEKDVELWAEAEMLTVIQHAKNGDGAYSQQGFEEAELFYLQGLEVLQAIEANIPAIFADYMKNGHSAIREGEPAPAQQAFSIAAAIDPESTEAASGYKRSLVLEDVLGFYNEAATLHGNNLLENARELYQQALSVDTQHIASQEALTQVGIDIIDRDFSGFMSQGYASIQADAPELAETSFRQALALKPGSSQALSALEQAADKITLDAITIHLNAAQAHVNSENWQEALSEYEQAIVVDPNVVAAVDGRNYANSRNNLDLFLQNALQAPLRLADTSVYEQAVSVLNDASKLADGGPKLKEQLQQVSILLEKVTQAVSVSFTSDGITNVTIARISNLGQFTSQSLSLTPGAYVAIGIRDGFRDVRKEFIVPIDGQVPLITVQCDEAI